MGVRQLLGFTVSADVAHRFAFAEIEVLENFTNTTRTSLAIIEIFAGGKGYFCSEDE